MAAYSNRSGTTPRRSVPFLQRFHAGASLQVKPSVRVVCNKSLFDIVFFLFDQFFFKRRATISDEVTKLASATSNIGTP